MTVKKNGKEKIIEANRETIRTLLALSAKHDKLINFETALQNFLCPVWNRDGTIHWTTEEFPDDIIEILTNEDDSDTIAIEEPHDSDEEGDD